MTIRISLLLVAVATLASCHNSAKDREQPAAATPLAPEPAPSARGKYPVQCSSSSHLTVGSVTEARARYALDESDGFGELEGEGKPVRPTNCVQWAELHGKKYKPTSAVEEALDTGARLRCSTLKLLEDAKAAERSYVRDLSWNGDMLAILPPEVATALDDQDTHAIERARGAGRTFKEFDPNARAKPSSDNELLEIIQGNEQTMVRLSPMAWGDFDGDGIDDIVMTVVNSATQGRLSYSRLLVVTRSSASEKLRVIGSL